MASHNLLWMRRLEPVSPTIHRALVLSWALHCPQSTIHAGVRNSTRISSNISPAPNKNTGPLSCRHSVVANIKWCDIRHNCAIERRSSLSRTWPFYPRDPAR
ncbi:hypothetical protein M441DRAFT_274082 [Trichoderma asperellum CBS 433.97]|uniref:Uncharacterized protein n=1 Tax=Trichoderma asperellum (strain ATCC 204424 / CBS 433.97 / NBRC 101777) TaxID=1042311 RepID=A0A2T3YWV8_TRIA4|nr:hypothetical protein M441DRAFT_274082 [Trichoderma asperellum CBS 433.97]PTB37020.1 hypothetical protein M441DRAFT_274082 [Trichoderma asperellum CBS 433.97]